MIVFDLRCSNDHQFEGWFDDSRAYEEQKAKNLVECPVCSDTNVSRVPSGFTIKSQSGHCEGSCQDDGPDLVQLSRVLAEYVDKNFENVGCNFATEALKMHYGVTEPRNIRGTSTPEEEKTLEKEGIKFFKVPVVSSSSETSGNDT